MSEERLVIDMSVGPERLLGPASAADTASSCREPEITSTTVDGNSPFVRSKTAKRRGILQNKPNMSYVSMIVLAINSVPERQLTLSQIYEYMRRRWADAFDGQYVGWKNSVRHNLSLNDCFVKVPKGVGDSGKGHKWRLQDGWQSMFERHNDSYKRRPRGFRPNPQTKDLMRPVIKSEQSVHHSSAQREGKSSTFSPVFHRTSFYAQSTSESWTPNNMYAFSEHYGQVNNTGNQSVGDAAGVTTPHPFPMFGMQHCFPGDQMDSQAMASSTDWSYEFSHQPEFRHTNYTN